MPNAFTVDSVHNNIILNDGTTIAAAAWRKMDNASRLLLIERANASRLQHVNPANHVTAQSRVAFFNKDPQSLSKALDSVRRRQAVLTWQSKGRYTYAAIFAGKWYITGDGGWYGSNVFEDSDDFIVDVLCHPEVTHIHLWTEPTTLFSC